MHVNRRTTHRICRPTILTFSLVTLPTIGASTWIGLLLLLLLLRLWLLLCWLLLLLLQLLLRRRRPFSLPFLLPLSFLLPRLVPSAPRHPLVVAVHTVDALARLREHQLVDPVFAYFAFETMGVI